MRKQVLFLVCLPILMVGLAYAAVPMYKVFCAKTGYGGTIKRAKTYSAYVGKKTIEVSFNADVSRELPWKFAPLQDKVLVKTGKRKLAFYQAENLTDEEIVGMAVYNVVPNIAGKYFNKVACFCFSRQVLAPHQSSVMPISFFIDPKIEEDPDIGDIQQITLSYTFFKIE